MLCASFAWTLALLCVAISVHEGGAGGRGASARREIERLQSATARWNRAVWNPPVVRVQYPRARAAAAGARLQIHVLGKDRAASLQRLLRSLAQADYAGDAVDVHIHIDHSSANAESVAVARAFAMPAGNVSCSVARAPRGLRDAWLQAWDPREGERAVILEDDIELSPRWYVWLTRAWLAYGARADLAGVSLQRQTLVPRSPHRQHEIVNGHAPFLYALVGSIGFSPHWAQWRAFRAWMASVDAETVDVSTPGLVTSEWFDRLDRRQMWTQYFVWFCRQRGLYTLYVNLPGGETLAAHMRAKGEHFSGRDGRDFAVAAAVPLAFPAQPAAYGWDGALRETRGGDGALRETRGGDGALRETRGGDGALRETRGWDGAQRETRGGDGARCWDSYRLHVDAARATSFVPGRSVMTEPTSARMLCGLLTPQTRVLEWGAGASTLFFSQFVRRWDAVEHDAAWLAQVQRHAAGMPHVHVHRAAHSWDKRGDGTYEQFREYVDLPGRLGLQYDVILVDGRARAACVLATARHNLSAPGGLVVVHDWDHAEFKTVLRDFALVREDTAGRRHLGILRAVGAGPAAANASAPPANAGDAAAAVHAARGFVNLQILNRGYLELTKSWICNVRAFPGVLAGTLFVATDRVSYDALRAFDGSLRVSLEPYASPPELKYGEAAYYHLMLFRTTLLQRLLARGVVVWLTESDAVWLRDPTRTVLATAGDLVTMSDTPPPQQMTQGGFLLLRPTPATVRVWARLAAQLARTMARAAPGEDMGDRGSEQLMLDALVRSEPGLRVGWLDPALFVSGQYYQRAPSAASPSVILNNWIIGNAAKKKRAQTWRHWFVGAHGECLPAPPRVVTAGGAYGGWAYDASAIGAASIVYSVGLGEDTSWDEAMMQRHGLEVWGFDPTPKSIRYVRANARLPAASFHFTAEGLHTAPKRVVFTQPVDSKHVSMRQGRDPRGGATVVAQVNSLRNWMRAFGHREIDILKIDIEGSEYDVIEDWVQAQWFPMKQLLVEFHPQWLANHSRHAAALRGLHAAGFDIVNDKGGAGVELSFRRRAAVGAAGSAAGAAGGSAGSAAGAAVGAAGSAAGAAAVNIAASLAPSADAMAGRGSFALFGHAVATVPIVMVALNTPMSQVLAKNIPFWCRNNNRVVVLTNVKQAAVAGASCLEIVDVAAAYRRVAGEVPWPAGALADERVFVHRWYVIREWMRSAGVPVMFTMDSDAIMTLDVTRFVAANLDVIRQHELWLYYNPPRASGLCFLASLAALEDITLFFNRLLTADTWTAEFVKDREPNDMVALGHYVHSAVGKPYPCWGLAPGRQNNTCDDSMPYGRTKILRALAAHGVVARFAPGTFSLDEHGRSQFAAGVFDNNYRHDPLQRYEMRGGSKQLRFSEGTPQFKLRTGAWMTLWGYVLEDEMEACADAHWRHIRANATCVCAGFCCRQCAPPAAAREAR